MGKDNDFGAFLRDMLYFLLCCIGDCCVLVTEKFVLFIFVFIFASNIGRENESVLFLDRPNRLLFEVEHNNEKLWIKSLI